MLLECVPSTVWICAMLILFPSVPDVCTRIGTQLCALESAQELVKSVTYLQRDAYDFKMKQDLWIMLKVLLTLLSRCPGSPGRSASNTLEI